MMCAVPECVCCQVALAAASGFQFDKGSSRGVEGAHHGEAHTEDH